MKVYEGNILTVDKKDAVVQYLVEQDGRIVYTGDVLPDEYNKAERVVLGERALIPAFADTHIHFASFATFHAGLNVMNARSNAEILAMLKEYVARTNEKLVIGFGASPYSVSDGKLPRIGGCFEAALDGCFGSKDAALLAPYEGSDDTGVLYYSDEAVAEFCKKANRAGLQISIHAIGDRAFEQAAYALKAALDDYPREDHRHSIIHACLPTEDSIALCQQCGILLPVQSAFINWAQEPDAYLKEILGGRAAKLNPLNTFTSHDILLCAGSDGPCTDPDPIQWMYKACNHSIAEESLTVQQALRMCTYNGYYATFDEAERGSLETGKIADMVILSDNPYKIPITELGTLKVEQLLLQGKPYQPVRKGGIGHIVRGMMNK